MGRRAPGLCGWPGSSTQGCFSLAGGPRLHQPSGKNRPGAKHTGHRPHLSLPLKRACSPCDVSTPNCASHPPRILVRPRQQQAGSQPQAPTQGEAPISLTRKDRLHSTDQETKAQRGELTGPRSHSQKAARPDSDSQNHESRPRSPHTPSEANRREAVLVEAAEEARLFPV